MTHSENLKWNLDEITEAFEGSILPEDVAAIMTRFAERKQIENQETERMNNALRLIVAYNAATLLDSQHSMANKPDYVIDASVLYLSHQRDKEVVDELDRNVRLASLYTLAAFELPYSNYEDTLFSKYLPKHPINGSEIRTMLKDYVIGKFGEDKWQSGFDELDFEDLFYEMTHFDGEPIGEVLSRQSIFTDIKQELTRKGFSVNAIEEGEE
jgi:hypothetical protein